MRRVNRANEKYAVDLKPGTMVAWIHGVKQEADRKRRESIRREVTLDMTFSVSHIEMQRKRTSRENDIAKHQKTESRLDCIVTNALEKSQRMYNLDRQIKGEENRG